ncbi:Protein of unknown function [Pyronema omphalodes CBS 100304]|uniref:Uncharacterized protein n=1 Tax=Pyronema omphalodes (strain CBS 100304) TaxID=1076935 RepID=U4L6R7_PYROM|nr:Protein of unknown function [Pyronema omphalodes CBS 100304]
MRRLEMYVFELELNRWKGRSEGIVVPKFLRWPGLCGAVQSYLIPHHTILSLGRSNSILPALVLSSGHFYSLKGGLGKPQIGLCFPIRYQSSRGALSKSFFNELVV